MLKSYRIKSQPGVDKDIRIKIDQDFDFLEILSLKLRQEDVYTRFCADYGVLAGRVIANGGYGVPNVMISVFIPLDDMDENNPIISTLYPYKKPGDKNDDGYRYNLLPYENEYNGHTATGTFPTREDVLTRKEVLQVYEKYYKYTVKTNDSGDFMIVGVPLGQHKVVMDLDLSNIGEFSLRPSDLIRMGIATPSQFSGELFKSSENLDALPQILHDVVDVDVASFWGEEDTCDVGITRVDFDLRELGIEIEPTCVFMGSMFSSSEDDFLRANCKPKSNTGNLCDTVAGPGQILSIRQTINEDSNGDPILEQYILENGGNVIDENGVWLVDIPMNMDYVITNEFGERVVSNDPTIGIPTTGKYRFKIKWQNEDGLQGDILRANYLVPNIKEHWGDSATQPTNLDTSYTFSLDWEEYYDKVSAINCDDTFYKFNYNKVYTVASHIDRYKFGWNRARHLGIKEITDRACQSENNNFPVNDAQRNFDFLNFVFSILLTITTLFLYAILPLIHVLALLYPIIRLLINFIFLLVNGIIYLICLVVNLFKRKSKKLDCQKQTIEPLPKKNPFTNLTLPTMSYPDCEACNCKVTALDTPDNQTITDLESALHKFNTGILSDLTIRDAYETVEQCYNETEKNEALRMVISGYDYFPLEIDNNLMITAHPLWYLSPIFPCYNSSGDRIFKISNSVTLAQSMNLINQRDRYFRKNQYGQINSNRNIIKTSVVNNQNGPQPGGTYGSFTDLPLIVMVDSNTNLEPGQLLTTVNPNNIDDVNVSSQQTVNKFGTKAITGTLEYLNQNSKTYIPKQVRYVNQNSPNDEITSIVYLYNTQSESDYKFKSGLEYYQVVTGVTISELYEEFLVKIKPGMVKENSILYNHIINLLTKYGCDCDTSSATNQPNYIPSPLPTQYASLIDGTEQIVYILTKGVDPYTPKQMIEYDLSVLFGMGDFTGDYKVNGDYYMNIPIQKNLIGVNQATIQYSSFYNNRTPEPHYLMKTSPFSSGEYLDNTNNNSNSNLYHSSYLFTPDTTLFTAFDTTGFTTYSSMDGTLAKSPINNYIGSNGFMVNNSNIIINTTNTDFSQGRIDGCSYQYAKNSFGTTLSGIYDGLTISTTYTKSFVKKDADVPKTTMSLPTKLIFRSDRLPSSDYIDFGIVEDSLTLSSYIILQNYVLHLNSGFRFYTIDDNGDNDELFQDVQFENTDTTGNLDDFNEDITDTKLTTITDTFNCGGMIPLECYKGEGSSFGPSLDCEDDDRVVNGCYVFVKNPYIISYFTKDIKYISEWSTRFRFMFAACRGVIGTMFQNNWVNGTLYMPAFQKRNHYNNSNEVDYYIYCGYNPTSKIGPIYFNETSNSFFYRSTPYGDDSFIGQTPNSYQGANQKNIWFPTTIMDLGPKTEFLKEIVLSPDFEGYIIDTIKSTSYKDVSDIINIFIISRLVNADFIERILRNKDGSIQGLFSRENGGSGLLGNYFDARIDGDAAQLFSINSEYGVTPYLNDNYSDDKLTVNNGIDSVIGVLFDSNRENRLILTPGITTFATNITNQFGYPNSQEVPYYTWKINKGSNGFLFGNQYNSWNTANIKWSEYQGDDFGLSSNYMAPTNNPYNINNFGYGYIYNMDGSGNPSYVFPSNQQDEDSFKVGAPFHFYFGLKRGKSAINRFITKYIRLTD